MKMKKRTKTKTTGKGGGYGKEGVWWTAVRAGETRVGAKVLAGRREKDHLGQRVALDHARPVQALKVATAHHGRLLTRGRLSLLKILLGLLHD
jgi:hypothetical protein